MYIVLSACVNQQLVIACFKSKLCSEFIPRNTRVYVIARYKSIIGEQIIAQSFSRCVTIRDQLLLKIINQCLLNNIYNPFFI